MKILALDISANNTGWCIFEDGKEVEVNSKSFSAFLSEYGMLFAEYEAWLTFILRTHKPDVVAYEDVNGGLQGKARYLLTGMNAITRKQIVKFGLPYLFYSATTIKKFMTDNGRASKEDMIQAAKDRGHTPDNADEADAIAIALKAHEELKTP